MIPRHLNIEAVKAAAAGRWVEILSQLGNVAPAILDGKHHPCPKCGGVDRFRMFDETVGAVLCNQCFHQKNGDGLAAIEWLTGDPFNVVLRRVAMHLGIDPLKKSNGHADESDIVERIARRKRVPVESLKAFGAHRAKRKKMTVCRVPMYGPDGSQCSYLDMSEFNADWLKGYNQEGKPSGIFLAGGKRPEEGKSILIVEGVKDAAALHSLDFQAVGLPTN